MWGREELGSLLWWVVECQLIIFDEAIKLMIECNELTGNIDIGGIHGDDGTIHGCCVAFISECD